MDPVDEIVVELNKIYQEYVSDPTLTHDMAKSLLKRHQQWFAKFDYYARLLNHYPKASQNVRQIIIQVLTKLYRDYIEAIKDTEGDYQSRIQIISIYRNIFFNLVNYATYYPDIHEYVDRTYKSLQDLIAKIYERIVKSKTNKTNTTIIKLLTAAPTFYKHKLTADRSTSQTSRYSRSSNNPSQISNYSRSRSRSPSQSADETSSGPSLRSSPSSSAGSPLRGGGRSLSSRFSKSPKTPKSSPHPETRSAIRNKRRRSQTEKTGLFRGRERRLQ